MAQLHSGDGLCLTGQARVLSKLNRHAEATRKFCRVVQLNPDVLLARQNLLDEATLQFEIALSLDPASAAAGQYLQQVTARRDRSRY